MTLGLRYIISMVKTRTLFRKITHSLFLLLFALIYKDLNFVKTIFKESFFCCFFCNLTLLLLWSITYTTWGVAGRKRRLSAACRNAWAGGMLYKDSVSLTPFLLSLAHYLDLYKLKQITAKVNYWLS